MRGVTVWPRALGLGIVLWVLLLFTAPLAIVSANRPLSMGAALVYGAGARVCHQRPERCFRVAGRPLPVCARCTGLYAGAAIAAPVALLASGLSGRRARSIAVLAAVPTLVTWSVEAAGFVHPSNTVRAIAALPLGFVAAWLVMATFVHGSRPDVVGPRPAAG
jgi:uncharacterized membrane protein